MIVEVAVSGNPDFIRLLEAVASEPWGFSAEALQDPEQVTSVYLHVPGNQDEALETTRDWLAHGSLPGTVGTVLPDGHAGAADGVVRGKTSKPLRVFVEELVSRGHADETALRWARALSDPDRRLYFLGDDHFKRYLQVPVQHRRDRWEAPLAYLMSTTHFLWKLFRDGRYFAEGKPRIDLKRITPGVDLIFVELGFALYHDGVTKPSAFADLDHWNYHACLQAIHIQHQIALQLASVSHLRLNSR